MTKQNLAKLAIQKAEQLFERLLRPFIDSFLPTPHYLENEEPQLVIRMAAYRARAPKVLAFAGIVVLFPALVTFVIMAIISRSDAPSLVQNPDTIELIAAGFVILALVLLFEAAQTWLAYHQWQFILTDKRLILVTPDPDRQGFADAIYLSKGAIKIIDTNYSKSPLWGIFQILLGSRDVMFSPGYEFREEGAKVKGGLRFPDVEPEDIKRLEQEFFG